MSRHSAIVLEAAARLRYSYVVPYAPALGRAAAVRVAVAMAPSAAPHPPIYSKIGVIMLLIKP